MQRYQERIVFMYTSGAETSITLLDYSFTMILGSHR